MRATFAARRAELEVVTEDDRTAADVVLSGMLEIKNIDKQPKNQAVKGKVCLQTQRLSSKWKTVKAKATRARLEADEACEWIGRALQLKKLVKKRPADEARNDPEGHARLQALFSNEDIKTEKWQDLLWIKTWEEQVQTVPCLSGEVGPIPRHPEGCKDREETTATIRSLWEDGWEEETLEGESLRQARACLVEPIKVLASKNKTERTEWSTPDEDAWKRVHARAAGSGHGFSGGELKALPSGVNQTLRKDRRTVAGDGERHRRSVILETTQLAEARESIHGEECGSIFGSNVWWRLFQSAVIQSSSFRNWRGNIGVGHLVTHRDAAGQRNGGGPHLSGGLAYSCHLFLARLLSLVGVGSTCSRF